MGTGGCGFERQVRCPPEEKARRSLLVGLDDGRQSLRREVSQRVHEQRITAYSPSPPGYEPAPPCSWSLRIDS